MKKIHLTKHQKPFIIAEIAQTHDGNVNIAHAFIDAVAKAGADAIKFQTHIAEEESTASEPWRVKFSYQDYSRYDYWKRMEFSEDQWAALKKHADDRGVYFLSSPFSVAAVALLERINVPAWKIGSGEVLSQRMIEAIASTGKPLILSTGMSDFSEIDRIVSGLKQRKIQFALMQCTTAYPSSFERVGLNVLEEFRKRYDCPVGLSDHTGSIWPSIAAVSRGAEVIEVHITFSRDMFGPDVSSSLTIEELAQTVQGVNAIWTMLENPVDKSIITDDLKSMRQLFMKSVVARQDLGAGETLTIHNLAEKKPGTGIPAEYLSEILGLTLIKSLKKDEQLTAHHLSERDRALFSSLSSQKSLPEKRKA